MTARERETHAALRALLQSIVDGRPLHIIYIRALALAAVIGCAVCGREIPERELRDCSHTRATLVHLWGDCSDRLRSERKSA